ncbi:hypothetical protein Tco_1295227 [Tanacetum coccineum]
MGRPLLGPQWAWPFSWPDLINEVRMCKSTGTSKGVDENKQLALLNVYLLVVNKDGEAGQHIENLLLKTKTSETTSHATLESAHGGFNLNKADDLEDEEEKVQEARHMGRDIAKKKVSSSSTPIGISYTAALVLG